MDIVIKRFNKMMNTSIMMFILDIIVGVFLVVDTELITKVCAILIGGLLLVHGIFDIIRYIYDGIEERVFAVMIISGIASLILGGFMIFNHYEVLKALGIVFGIWMLLNGLEKLYYAIRLMQKKDEIYPLTMFIAILIVIMGILIIVNPFSSFMLVTKLSGYFMIASALLNIMYCLLLKKRAKSVLSLFK